MNQDNITFNNVKQTIDFGMGPVGIAGQTGVDPEWGGVINAIDIDWNAANLGNNVNIDANGGTSNGNSAEINTTGALLSYISALAQRIDNIESVSIYPFRRICNPVA